MVDTTDSAREAYNTAIVKDQEWVLCLDEQREKLQKLEDANAALDEALIAPKAPCAAKVAAAPYNKASEDQDLSFACDLRLEGNCASRMDAFNKNVDGVIKELDEDFSSKKQTFQKAKDACDDAEAALVKATQVQKRADRNFRDKVGTCINKQETRDESVCLFGGALATKCRSKSAFKQLASQVNGTESVFSDEDRQKEWKVIQITKCALQGLVDAGSLVNAVLNQEALDKCRMAVKYNKDVGVLDTKSEDFQEYTTGDAFSCDETGFDFSGFKWTIPIAKGREAVHSSDWDKTEYTEPVTSGPLKFEVCNV